ncbi:MAG TPA: carboxypeptidase-like regulatory domain-containing protein [Vicinamibacterales bacterium]
MTLTEYNRLLDLASRPPAGSQAVPVPALLSGASATVRVDRDSARGTFSLSGQVLRAGVSRVNLISGATLVDANAAGRPLPLVADGNAHAALLPGPGPFSLTLEWGAPLTFSPGRASFVLPVPPAGTARASFDLPGEQADVHLSAGLVTRRTIAGGRTIVEATLAPGTSTEVWWSMRDSTPVAAAKDARLLADVMTLVTLGDSDVRMVGLIDLTIVQGEPRSVEVQLPGGYEVTGISGSSLESSEQHDGSVVLTIANPAARRQQFLVSLERAHEPGSFAFETGMMTVPAAQRERGDIAVEGVGTLELTSRESEGVRRIDVRELGPAMQTLSRQPILSAFRYQRAAAAPPTLSLDVKRFGDAGVIAAVADRATATTLVTAEGRALTEVSLLLRNRAQPFLKVTLPEGASIVSVEVAGETAKPVLGADGTRVPLLRQGLRPQGPYVVSFVYLHAGAPFGKKGDMDMALPKLDMPIGLIEWEVFVPENYSVRATGGNVIERAIGLTSSDESAAAPAEAFRSGRVVGGVTGGIVGGLDARIPAVAGQIVGRVFDTSGAVLPGVTVDVEVGSVRRTATTDGGGVFRLSSLPSGAARLTAHMAGFTSQTNVVAFNQEPLGVNFTLAVGAVAETVTVAGQAPAERKNETGRPEPPSQNVVNLQRRAAGVLPIRVEVPRAGTSHQFVKPLVIDQAATVSFKYKRR